MLLEAVRTTVVQNVHVGGYIAQASSMGFFLQSSSSWFKDFWYMVLFCSILFLCLPAYMGRVEGQGVASSA